jgi:hypothetical protein
MRPPVPTHPDDDRLLELAYGEAPASEARVLRQHVDGCARCRKVLEGIAEVRSVFRSVPAEPAPERGLESLLAYGEQAAARARSRRGGLRILALLSAATAFALVWLVLPSPQRQSDGLVRAPATRPTDTLAQAEAPAAPAQGDRARDEFDDRKSQATEQEKKIRPVGAPVAPMAKSEGHREEQAQPQRRIAAEPSKQKELAKLDAPADAEAAARSVAGSDLSGALGKASASGGKVGAAGPNAAAGAGSLGSGSFAMKKGNAGARVNSSEKAPAPTPSSPPASVAVATPPPGEARGADAQAQQAAKIAAAPLADAVAAEDKDVGASGVASTTAARNAAKPAPTVQSMRTGAGSPEKQARLAEIRRQLETAKGDQRKALLAEKCEIEASLQLGPDAVLTCSMVGREFPGTPEAKRASDLARGFSVQLPAGEDR